MHRHGHFLGWGWHDLGYPLPADNSVLNQIERIQLSIFHQLLVFDPFVCEWLHFFLVSCTVSQRIEFFIMSWLLIKGYAVRLGSKVVLRMDRFQDYSDYADAHFQLHLSIQPWGFALPAYERRKTAASSSATWMSFKVAVTAGLARWLFPAQNSFKDTYFYKDYIKWFWCISTYKALLVLTWIRQSVERFGGRSHAAISSSKMESSQIWSPPFCLLFPCPVADPLRCDRSDAEAKSFLIYALPQVGPADFSSSHSHS